MDEIHDLRTQREVTELRTEQLCERIAALEAAQTAQSQDAAASREKLETSAAEMAVRVRQACGGSPWAWDTQVSWTISCIQR